MFIPDDLVAYSRSPVFTQDTVPSALQKPHETKRGVWALVHSRRATNSRHADQ